MLVLRQYRSVSRLTGPFRFNRVLKPCLRALSSCRRLSAWNFMSKYFRQNSTLQPSLEEATDSTSKMDLFEKFGLDLSIVTRLSSLSIVKPTWIQNEAIPVILRDIDRIDFVIGAETGSGKTYTYLVPIIQTIMKKLDLYCRKFVHIPVVIIVVPTRPLCQQVAKFGYDLCNGTSVSIGAVLSGDNTAWPFSKHFKASPDILVCTPAFLSRFISEDNSIFPLLRSQVRFVVFDEADLVLQGKSGAEFIQTVIRAFRSSSLSPFVHFLLCAATIPSTGTLSVDANTRRLFPTATWIFNSSHMHRIHPLITVEFVDMKNKSGNLSLRFPDIERRVRLHVGLPLSQKDFKKKIFKKKQKLRKLRGFDDDGDDDDKKKTMIVVDDLVEDVNAQKLNGNQVIIFANTIESCETIYNEFVMRKRGFSDQIVMFHSEMENTLKDESLEQFRSGRKVIMICTDVISRGIDVPAVSLVVQAEFPTDAVQYLHRSGRCSRGGRLGHCVCYYDDETRELASEIMVRERESLEGVFSRKRSFRRNIKRKEEREAAKNDDDDDDDENEK